MSVHLAAVRAVGAQPSACPVYRSIVAVDLEGSTKRTNVVKGELRRVMYELLDRALTAAGIGPNHLEDLVDRGDGVLILVRPHDDVPKTVLLGRLMPVLTALLAGHNAQVTRPELELRLRAVVHAGEVHYDGRGFYGDDLDVAFRLLDAPAAIAARGFPATDLAVPLRITDEQCPANAGRWQLTVRAGKAQLIRTTRGSRPAESSPSTPGRPGDEPPLALGARGLAALYAGTPVATLRRTALATGGTPEADAALDAAFAATPYMLDSF